MLTESIDPAALDELRSVLEHSRRLGFLGPGDVDVHIDNGVAFLEAIRSAPLAGPRTDVLRVLDLGSGGGVPGLVMAKLRTDLETVLLDAAQRRTTFLEHAVSDLAVSDRTRVVRGRAEEMARDPELRQAFDVVTARSFGPPAVTVECALGFVQGPGGVVLVSEPPDGGDDRWASAALAEVGVRLGPVMTQGTASIRRLDVVDAVPDRIPRRVGVPGRRPLF